MRSETYSAAFSGMLLALCLSVDTPCFSDDEFSTGKSIQLFDGETLFGWHATSDAGWRVVDGSIAVESGEPGFLMSNLTFGDFELTLEFSAPSATNSGVFVRSADNATNPATDCYEVNIADRNNPFPLGSIVARQRGREIQNATGTWQSMAIRAEGERIVVSIDGKLVTDYQDQRPLRRGKIGLQFNQGPVRFRQIRLRPLGLQSLFNGRNLDGWKTYPELKGTFRVADGQLRVHGGPGQLESTSPYDDFMLQVECRTNARLVNSGIFFRCIPGEPLMGYEAQIHHGYRDGDRSRPTDGGTGAIFRRQDARRVVASDLEWFDMTIAAVDDQFAAWVNGFQVSSWRDIRTANKNPRLGKRLEAGTIMIQAHDPTADVSLRNMRISRIAR